MSDYYKLVEDQSNPPPGARCFYRNGNSGPPAWLAPVELPGWIALSERVPTVDDAGYCDSILIIRKNGRPVLAHPEWLEREMSEGGEFLCWMPCPPGPEAEAVVTAQHEEMDLKWTGPKSEIPARYSEIQSSTRHPFCIFAALAGAGLVTRDGHKVHVFEHLSRDMFEYSCDGLTMVSVHKNGTLFGEESVDSPNDLFLTSPAPRWHNPDKLTPEQIGAPEFRLLVEGEVDRRYAGKCEYWAVLSKGWFPAEHADVSDITYRVRLSDHPLPGAKDQEPEEDEDFANPTCNECTGGNTPLRFDKGPCEKHRKNDALALPPGMEFVPGEEKNGQFIEGGMLYHQGQWHYDNGTRGVYATDNLEVIRPVLTTLSITAHMAAQGVVLGEGQRWHRLDWTAEMLPRGWRPLLNRERRQAGDQFFDQEERDWFETRHIGRSTVVSDTWMRTRRPLPASEEAKQPLHQCPTCGAPGECDCFGPVASTPLGTTEEPNDRRAAFVEEVAKLWTPDTPESPLATQVGGSHYRDMPIQPVEFITKNGLTFLEGSVVKRICRWRRKDGIKDLEKARHEIALIIEMETTQPK